LVELLALGLSRKKGRRGKSGKERVSSKKGRGKREKSPGGGKQNIEITSQSERHLQRIGKKDTTGPGGEERL